MRKNTTSQQETATDQNPECGFENTWFVRAFESRKERDEWVYDTNSIDRRA